MSNSGMDVLYPEVWAAELDKILIGDYPLSRLVSNRMEIGAGKLGDKVHVPLTPDLGEADDYSGASSPTMTNVTQQEVSVELTDGKNKGVTITRDELTRSAYDLIAKYLPAIIKPLLRAVDLKIYKTMLLSNYIVDMTTTFDETSIVDMYKVLDQNEVRSDGRVLIAGPDDYANMLKFAAFSHADIAGDSQAIREGKLPRRYGFEIGKGSIISKYTPTDVAGAINNASNYTSADYTIAVNAFNDDTNPIRVGDIFTVADETGSPKHTVQSTALTSSDTTGITFLTKHDNTNEAKLDTKVVTVTPTRSLVAFVPEGIAFASKPFATLPEGLGARQMVMPLFPGGPAFCLSIWMEGLNVKVNGDILYGCTMVNRKRVVRGIID